MSAAEPVIWITADDFGLAPGVNAGVTELAERQRLSAVSIMVHPGADLERLESLRNSGPKLGLHLVFVDERPLLPAGQLARIVDPDGRLPSYPRLFRRVLGRPELGAALRREAEAQVDRYLGLGIPLDFINSHQHVHLFPPVWHALMPLFTRFRDSKVRSGAPGTITWSKQGLVNSSSRLAAWRDPLPTDRLVAPLGVAHAGHLTVERIEAEVAAWLRNGGRTHQSPGELVMHPALEDADLRRRYGHWRFGWQQEYTLLASDQLQAVFKRHSVRLAGGA